MTNVGIRSIAGMSVLPYLALVTRLFVPASFLLALSLANCGAPKANDLAVREDEVCALIKNAVVAQGQYREAQIASCDPVSEMRKGYLVTRLNGHCREEICGSVLLGWYAVHRDSRRVFKWTVGDDTPGAEIYPAS